ncbi:MAG: hypothetical protein NW226_11950 [Microscillaceae bacterium]|nr:hypothetical protein [Microscillaceae bacterium]
MNYTYEQVLSLATDAGNAKKVATKTLWSNHGADAQCVWGECKGSGQKPYYTAIDLNGPAFKCSCPSRQFPCKHSIGLFLLYVSEKTHFTNQEPPNWVLEWILKRHQNAAQKKEKEISPEQKAKNDADKVKRQEKRIQTMQSGLNDLEVWIQDIVRQGLGNLRTDDLAYWDEQSRRMTDAQLKGISNLLREVQDMLPQENWMELVLERLAEINLLIQVFKTRSKLPPDLEKDLMNWIGVNTKKEDIIDQAGLKDTWSVLSVTETEEDLFTTRKTWLWGQQSQRFALILDFYRDEPPNLLVAGISMKAEMVFYPSAFPLRALIKDIPANHEPIIAPLAFDSFVEFLDQYASDHQKIPFHWTYPCIIHRVSPAEYNGYFCLLDHLNHQIELNRSYTKKWKILAISGGHPFTIFGDWKNYRLEPLALFVQDQYYDL